MEHPFYGNYWSHPRASSNMKGIPVQSIHHKPTEMKPTTKVVQIPVHFVNSDPDRSVWAKPEPDRSGSALRIQKVFRGYLVRKSVKRIMSIRKEVEDIERKVLCREKGELIRSDEKERLRVNETLMSLLFKLDSIRGVDSGVRELRKAVIRKAIFLQEKIDSIVFAAANQIATEEENQYNDSDELSEPVNQDEYGKSTIQSVDVQNQAASNDEKTPVEGELQDCPMEGSEERGEVVGDVIDEQRLDGEDESRRNRELLEKMVEKNEKMMRMMNELCQTNEIQMRMLNSLTQRVDLLEKAFVCDRLQTKKKKKKNRHPA
ncbi:hypothetical protein K7X08_003814 [Anisodus acutangulus]|uniref:BAG domain-containing protein n=1 Tax=Anisodus acutangulus TaxID=402998 RepID=A0A9Q1RK13_9SOLA|nr:hypothetical protein K7X08_003814 [Anisodus acutangulus]